MKKGIWVGVGMLIAMSVMAVPPEKRLDIDINWQQLQALEPISIQQGSAMRLAVRPKLQGQWATLTGWTARWEARANITNATCYQATSAWTSNDLHTIAIDLINSQTGTPVSDWVYSVILVSGGLDYPVGTGSVSIAQSGFTGSASIVSTNTTSVPNTRTITVDGVTGALSSNLTFTVSTVFTNGLASTNWVANVWWALQDASAVTAASIVNWDTAFGWGDHAAAGYYLANNPSNYMTQTITNGLASTNWVTAQGYGTGNLSKATADLTYTPINSETLATVTARGSNAPTAKISVHSVSATNTITTGTKPGFSGTALDVQNGSVWLRTGVNLLVDTIGGYSGNPIILDGTPNCSGYNVTNVGTLFATTVREGGISLVDKYAPKTVVYTNSGTFQMSAISTQLVSLAMNGNAWSFRKPMIWSTNVSFSATAKVSLFNNLPLAGCTEMWRNKSVAIASVTNSTPLLLATNIIPVVDGTPFSTLTDPFQIVIVDGASTECMTITNVTGNSLYSVFPSRFAHGGNVVVSHGCSLNVPGWVNDESGGSTLRLYVAFPTAQTVGIGYSLPYVRVQ